MRKRAALGLLASTALVACTDPTQFVYSPAASNIDLTAADRPVGEKSPLPFDAGQVYRFRLPRSLVLIGLEENGQSQALGVSQNGELTAMSVPTDAPMRARVFQEEENGPTVNGEDKEVDPLDPIDPDTPEASTQPASPQPLTGQQQAATDEKSAEGEQADGEEQAEGEEGEGEEEEVVFVPFTYEETELPTFELKPVGGRNAVHVTYFENTRMIASVGPRIADNRRDVIRTDSTNLIALANTSPVYFSDLPQPDGTEQNKLPTVLPTAIDVMFYLNELREESEWASLPFNEGWSYRIDVGEPPADAIPTDAFFKIVKSKKVMALPVSSCRDATLYLVQEEAENLDTSKEDVPIDFRQYVDAKAFYQFNFSVADPNWVQTATIPQDGQVVMHSACGADIKGSDFRGTEERIAISAAAAKARAVIDAWQKVLGR